MRESISIIISYLFFMSNALLIIFYLYRILYDFYDNAQFYLTFLKNDLIYNSLYVFGVFSFYTWRLFWKVNQWPLYYTVYLQSEILYNTVYLQSEIFTCFIYYKFASRKCLFVPVTYINFVQRNAHSSCPFSHR